MSDNEHQGPGRGRRAPAPRSPGSPHGPAAGQERAAPAPREDPRHLLGRRGEDAAAEYLRRVGFEVVARNVRMPIGELDLVALDGDVVVFVEVKARKRGGALEAVDARKQARLSRLALAFLARAGWLEREARFDVVAVDADGACTHVANAFDCTFAS